MKWFKDLLAKIFRSAIDTLIQETLDKAVAELNEDIDNSDSKKSEKQTLKSGVVLLRNKVQLKIRERL
jgi:hypothetical protein